MILLAAGGQANAETSINQNFINVLWAELFAMDPITTGITTLLTFGFKGGQYPINGLMTAIADGTVTLTASSTNFVGLSQAGTVVVTLTTANPLHAPLFTVVTGATTITTILDTRSAKHLHRIAYSISTQAMADANQSLTQALALCDSLITTGALTAQRNLVVPLIKRLYTVRNNCTGFGIQVIGATGTGIIIAIAKCAMVEWDGVNVVRVTADI
jgi:hypothetical protein